MSLTYDPTMDALTGTVEVTQAHIDNGVRCDCYRCPGALAILDALAGSGFPEDANRPVDVNGSWITVWGSGGVPFVSSTPEALRAFIHAFDDGKWRHLRPFVFPLTLTYDGDAWWDENTMGPCTADQEW